MKARPYNCKQANYFSRMGLLQAKKGDSLVKIVLRMQEASIGWRGRTKTTLALPTTVPPSCRELVTKS